MPQSDDWPAAYTAPVIPALNKNPTKTRIAIVLKLDLIWISLKRKNVTSLTWSYKIKICFLIIWVSSNRDLSNHDNVIRI